MFIITIQEIQLIELKKNSKNPNKDMLFNKIVLGWTFPKLCVVNEFIVSNLQEKSEIAHEINKLLLFSLNYIIFILCI